MTSLIPFFIQCDIFHPLSRLHWEELKWPGEKFHPCSQCVVFRNKLYICGWSSGGSHFLWSFTADLSYCSPSWIPTQKCGLIVYNSQLVLVGGNDPVAKEVCNKLWTSDDGLGWDEVTLPPMQIPRESPVAISFGNPECLVVAGGAIRVPRDARGMRKYTTIVEVLNKGLWSLVEPLPVALTKNCPWHFTLHNGSIYLFNRYHILCCNLDALLRSTHKHLNRSIVWKLLCKQRRKQIIMSFKGYLLVYDTQSRNINAYCPWKKSWVFIERSHFLDKEPVIIPAGNLFIQYQCRRQCRFAWRQCKFFKVTSKGECSIIMSSL